MEDLFAKIIFVLLIGVICAIVATNLINGLKDSTGLSDIKKPKWLKTLLIKLLTFAVDGFIDYWVYFVLLTLTDIPTFVVVVLCTIAGAETVYNIIGQLNELKEKDIVAENSEKKTDDEVTEEPTVVATVVETVKEAVETVKALVGYLPCAVANLTTEYKDTAPYHTGHDYGWIDGNDNIECPVTAWNDGVVVDKGFDAAARGNYLTIRHELNGQYRYTNYLHMRDEALVNVGDVVKAKQQIGVKGTTGGSTGVHLHFATSILTTETNKDVYWVANNAVNPQTCTFLSPDVDYALKKMDWILPMVADRDTSKHQFQVTEPELRIRKGAGKQYEATGLYIPVGIYDVVDTFVEENGYTWYKLATERWVAAAYQGNFDGYGIDLPANK